MSKFNKSRTLPAVFSPVTSETTSSGTTHQGAPGYARDTKSELFLLAVTNMVGENTFYEPGGQRDERYAGLVHAATLDEPAWTARFLRWLRTDASMRTASIVGAAEFVKARLDAAGTRPAGRHETAAPDGKWEGDNLSYSTVSNRAVVDSVLQRADEPGELLAYWTSVHGRAIPKPVKRGVADAVRRLYTERSYLKWDSDARGFRFGDVLNLAHPTAADERQADLYQYMLDVRYGNADTIPSSLSVLRANAALREHAAMSPEVLLHADALRNSGMTWEQALSLAGPHVDKARLWEALIPTMGYMALLRNLRNFDQAGVSSAVAKAVSDRLAAPEQVATSRQLPMRFLSAYRAAPSLRWSWALEQAITHSLSNVPALGGRTLVLVDTSSSMTNGFSKDGTLMRWDAAAAFGLALGARCAQADVVSFSSAQYYFNDPRGAKTKVFPLQAGESLLRSVERWKADGYFLGGGTDTAGALRKHFANHDRVIILTDEQTGSSDVDKVLPTGVPLYTWNLAGYQYGHAPSGSRNRHTFGGLTDAGFRMIPLLESGRDGHWPWLV